jgi:hypothetical protein
MPMRNFVIFVTSRFSTDHCPIGAPWSLLPRIDRAPAKYRAGFQGILTILALMGNLKYRQNKFGIADGIRSICGLPDNRITGDSIDR